MTLGGTLLCSQAEYTFHVERSGQANGMQFGMFHVEHSWNLRNRFVEI
jgi:hypothetical protein